MKWSLTSYRWPIVRCVDVVIALSGYIPSSQTSYDRIIMLQLPQDMTAGDVVMSLVDKVGLGGDSSAYTLTSFSSEGQLYQCACHCEHSS